MRRSITRRLSWMLIGSAVSCQPDANMSQISERITKNYTEEQATEALEGTHGLRINLKTNRATRYSNGWPVDQWNIATGDAAGQYHDHRAPTPTGIFDVHRMSFCPPWRPARPKWPETGKVAANESERQAIFKRYPSVYSSCGTNNPLGTYALWIEGAYGIHGNSNEAILERESPDARRVSGGCIRNPNKKISELFHALLADGPHQDLSERLKRQEQLPGSDRTEKQIYPDLDFKVVIGSWPEDPVPGPEREPTPVNTEEESLVFHGPNHSIQLSVRTERIYRATEPLAIYGQGSEGSFKGVHRVELWDGDTLFDSSLLSLVEGKFLIYQREPMPGDYHLTLKGYKKTGELLVEGELHLVIVEY